MFNRFEIDELKISNKKCCSIFILSSGINKLNEWIKKIANSVQVAYTYLPVFVMIISVPNSWNFSHKSFVSKWHWIGFNSSQLHEPKSVGRVCCRWIRKRRTHTHTEMMMCEWKREKQNAEKKENRFMSTRDIIYYWMIWLKKSNSDGLGFDSGFDVIKTTH